MAYNGSGTFARLYSWATDKSNNIKILASRMDAEMDGFATGLSTAICKDGQTIITADLPMAGYNHTGVDDADARDQYASAAQVQDGSLIWVDAGGTADAITAAYNPVITTLVDGQQLGVRAGAANATTTPSFSPNGLTARTIVKEGGNALVAGDIAGDGHELILRYDLSNTRWELLNPAIPTSIANVVEDTTPQAGGDLDMNGSDIQFDDATGIRDDSDNEQLIFQKTASAVNHVEMTNAATGNAPSIAAAGDDTNVDLDLTSKGSGTVNVNSVAVSGLYKSRQVFTSSDTWSRPTGCKFVLVRQVGGGGGGGGGGSTNTRSGGGGAGGGYAEKFIDVTSISSSTVTIGAAGTAGTGTGNGGAGGNTSWDDGTNTITTNGGAAGLAGSGNTATRAAGGTATGGDININGQQGGPDGGQASSYMTWGEGGSSPLGMGGRSAYDAVGGDGTGYGAGGSGGVRFDTARAGGAGSPGIVIVEEYY